MTWETAITLIGALGGLEAIKYLLESIRNRRTNKRKEAAGAASMELDNRSKEQDMAQKHNAYLEQQLQERNLKVDAMYKANEQLIEEKTQLLIENGQKDVAIEAAENARCNVNGCLNRQPPRRYSVRSYKSKKQNDNETKTTT